MLPGLFNARRSDLAGPVAGPEQLWSFSNLCRCVVEEGVELVAALRPAAAGRRIPAPP